MPAPSHEARRINGVLVLLLCWVAINVAFAGLALRDWTFNWLLNALILVAAGALWLRTRPATDQRDSDPR
jgi:hypothetical protein